MEGLTEDHFLRTYHQINSAAAYIAPTIPKYSGLEECRTRWMRRKGASSSTTARASRALSHEDFMSHPRAEDQQQHSSSLQFGQSRGDFEALHSTGEQPQSAQTMGIFEPDRGRVLGLKYQGMPLAPTMWFITLVKFRHKLTKKDLNAFDRAKARAAKAGVRVVGDYYTFGRFDDVIITEAPTQKPVMQFFLALSDAVATETLSAVTAKEGRKLLS